VQLTRYSRAAIVAAALACFSGAFALAPLSARSAANSQSPLDAPVPAASRALGSVSVISPRRDPFAGAPENDAATTTPGTQLIPRIPAGIGGLPSNLTGMIPLVPGAGVAGRSEPTRISAVVTGVHPYALVVENNETVIKAVGDKIDGLAIVGITIDGVMLEGGNLRRVTSSLLPPKPSAPIPVAPQPLAPQPLAVPSPVPQPSPTSLGSFLL
jgi:hypothetical protein